MGRVFIGTERKRKYEDCLLQGAAKGDKDEKGGTYIREVRTRRWGWRSTLPIAYVRDLSICPCLGDVLVNVLQKEGLLTLNCNRRRVSTCFHQPS